jgi:hypothetical protein
MAATELKLFQGANIRSLWDDKAEKWYFSIVDVVGVLADNPRPRKYWNDLKRKLLDEGSQLSDKIGQLKMVAPDGKMRETVVGNTEMRGAKLKRNPASRSLLAKTQSYWKSKN